MKSVVISSFWQLRKEWWGTCVQSGCWNLGFSFLEQPVIELKKAIVYATSPEAIRFSFISLVAGETLQLDEGSFRHGFFSAEVKMSRFITPCVPIVETTVSNKTKSKFSS